MKAGRLPNGIRRAMADDAAEISRLCVHVHKLHSAAYPDLFKPASVDAFPSSTVEELMADLDHIFFVAEEDGEAVGYIYIEIRDRAETSQMYARGQIHIHQLAIKPAYRRRGHGARLMLAAKMLMQEFDISTVTLATWAFNHGAQAFYERLGFAPMYQYLWIRAAESDTV